MHVNPSAVVVGPFECAWLTAPDTVLRDGKGCVSFECRGRSGGSVALPGIRRSGCSTSVAETAVDGNVGALRVVCDRADAHSRELDF